MPQHMSVHNYMYLASGHGPICVINRTGFFYTRVHVSWQLKEIFVLFLEQTTNQSLKIKMIRRQWSLPNVQSVFKIWKCFRALANVVIYLSDLVVRRSCIRVTWRENFLADFECFFIKFNSFCVFSLSILDHPKHMINICFLALFSCLIKHDVKHFLSLIKLAYFIQ